MVNDYFRLFQIKQNFNINFDELEKKYIELSKTNISSGRSQNMEIINKAYQVLKSPVKRAEHLLDLFDVRKNKKNDTINSEILKESMKIREYLLNLNNLYYINKIINNKLKDCTARLTEAFTLKNFNEINNQIFRLKYLYRASDELRKIKKYKQDI